MSGLRLAGRSRSSALSEVDLRMMRHAMELARQAGAKGEVPVGAVVYRGDQIITEAANNRETTRDPVGHAELIAVSEAGKKLKDWRLTDCSLAVTLEPCPMCAGAMVNARLGRLVYGATDPKAGADVSHFHLLAGDVLNHRVLTTTRILAPEAGDLLRTFFRRRR